MTDKTVEELKASLPWAEATSTKKGTIIMSTAETAVQAEAPVVIVASDPVFINTAWGAVAVFGHEFVSKKDLIILGLCL